MDILNSTIEELRKAMDEGVLSAVDVAKAYEENARNRNDEIHAYLEIFDDVEEQAQRADEMIKRGEIYPLTGIPIAIKDNILIKGRIASGASKILENYTASYDATVIQKLKEQGVVFIGRTNMDEFAMGSSTENSAFGETKNPHDTTRVPGGSSGGSAAAVSANMALVALGTDTGGSIRQPAALCGVVGFKPTYGAVSRYGAIAMGSSLDQIGPFARNARDAQMVFDAIKGSDFYDATSLSESTLKEPHKPKKIGVPRHFLTKGVDKEIMEAFEANLKKLEQNGYEIVDIELPSIEYALAVYYIVMPAEVSTNLARYDGIRYGVAKKGETLLDDYSKTRSNGFGDESRRRILLGTFVLSSGYADAYYRKAHAVRGQIREDFKKVFESGVDCIATPTTPTPAFKIGEKASDPLAMYAADIFTVPVNLTGVPAISVPMGKVDTDGASLPIGMQFIAPQYHDGDLFEMAKDFEKINNIK